MELYIKSNTDPNWRPDQLQVDEELAMLLTQIETLFFTNKGDVIGNPDFGLNLEDYVYSFRYNDSMLQGVVKAAINDYIPLSSYYKVDVEVEFTEETERSIVLINVIINDTYGIGLSI
ncbi:hypothetical protein N8Z10_00430 [bacterium]|nr:hypothetical protein [bacterium]